MELKEVEVAEKRDSRKIVFFSVLSLCSLVIGTGAIVFAEMMFYRYGPLEILNQWGFRLVLFSPIAAIAGVGFGLLIGSRRETKLSLAALGLFVVLLFWFIWNHGRVKPIHPRLHCGMNLKGLATAMVVYSGDYDDQFPTAEKWCDLLAERDDVGTERFLCPEAKAGPCNYALNPDGIDGSADVVLLFETGLGWNQVGGAELLTTEYHKGRGCNVAFADGHVEFVRNEDISKLRWK